MHISINTYIALLTLFNFFSMKYVALFLTLPLCASKALRAAALSAPATGEISASPLTLATLQERFPATPGAWLPTDFQAWNVGDCMSWVGHAVQGLTPEDRKYIQIVIGCRQMKGTDLLGLGFQKIAAFFGERNFEENAPNGTPLDILYAGASKGLKMKGRHTLHKAILKKRDPHGRLGLRSRLSQEERARWARHNTKRLRPLDDPTLPDLARERSSDPDPHLPLGSGGLNEQEREAFVRLYGDPRDEQ